MDWELRIDTNRCKATGQCVYVAPRCFTQRSDGIAAVLDPRGEPMAKVVAAVNSCCTEAISLHLGGSVVPVELADDWQRGITVEGPMVSVLDRLSLEHETLRASLRAVSEDGDPSSLVEVATAHLRSERDEAFPMMAELAGGRLTAAFEDGHDEVAARLRALTDGPEPRASASDVAATVTAVEAQIGLEEDLLFPIVLGALAQQARHESSATR